MVAKVLTPACMGFLVGFFMMFVSNKPEVLLAPSTGYTGSTHSRAGKELDAARNTAGPRQPPPRPGRTQHNPLTSPAGSADGKERARLFQPELFYKEGVLNQGVFDKLQQEVLRLEGRALSSPYDKRRKLIVDIRSNITKVMYSGEMTQVMRDLTQDPKLIPAFNFPVEVRVYDKSVGMQWHRDLRLFRNRQYEVVFTIENNDDATSEYYKRDSSQVSTLVTKPNSLVTLRADGVRHRVPPVRTGRRVILKAVYIRDETPTESYTSFMSSEGHEFSRAYAKLYPDGLKNPDGSDLLQYLQHDRE
eukprot:TRINITY_DN4530_c0_g3_i1.p1 TRINITY_DN4530_c0_g3~~TRINITY_DN4530_c0_g3_i1.p1  ORF type:complete len:304 (+),score=57.55 TRINITY_DN4530_c0_g3_i1:96-1007(+)